jgi:hypothetical protein
MKQIIIVLLIIVSISVILIGCSKKSEKTKDVKSTALDISSLISQLEQKGYYKYIDQSKVKEVKNNSIKYGYVFGWEESGRDFTEDAEDITEGGVSRFFESIKEFLKSQNVNVKITNEDSSGIGYFITINDKRYEIYSEKEQDSSDLWGICTNRSFAIVNKLLKEAGSKERVYVLYGGNDLRAIFLTDEMFEIINKYTALPEKEQPKVVSDEK